ncbi:MAG: carboxypeptidase-like regulatory domain-containing protein [Bacteroidota bacterium]
MKHPLFLCLLLCLPFLAWGQTYEIQGQVLDAENRPITAAKVTAAIRGQVPVGALSDEQGRFLIAELPPGLYFLEIQMTGYRPFKRPVSIKTTSRDLGTLTLKPADFQLDEVVIERQVPPAIQKGDTTEMNSDAFKTNPDATTEQLIEKMPGITVNGGQVTAQGEQVQQVLVDGREFFGSDPTAALRNLPAEVVDKIQVFDQQSEQAQQTGVDDGETVKTINIVTKVEMRNGSFGTQYAGIGYGDEMRYQVGGSYNYFSDARRISILGQVNNINKQNFSAEDLLGVVSSGSSRGRRSFGGGGRGGGGRGGGGGGSDVGEFLVGEQEGISETQAFGLNYTDEWGENWEVTGSYFLNRSDNFSDQLLFQQYLTDGDSAQVYDEGDTTRSINVNHRLSGRLRYRGKSVFCRRL